MIVSLSGLAQRVAALEAASGVLGKLAPYIDLDDRGNLHINLPDGASFAVREGDQNRIVIDAGGKVGLFGTDVLILDTAGGGQLSTGAAGTIVNGGPKASLHFFPDGRIQVVGDLQQDVPE